MTQQFKFGDIVLHKETGQKGSVIDFKFGAVVALHGDTHIETFDYDEIELIPHPDTERIDWLAAQDDIDITLGNVINLKQPDLRTAIDIAMQACIAAVAIKFTAHLEEMVARGEAERLPDGRYQIFEKAT